MSSSVISFCLPAEDSKVSPVETVCTHWGAMPCILCVLESVFFGVIKEGISIWSVEDPGSDIAAAAAAAGGAVESPSSPSSSLFSSMVLVSCSISSSDTLLSYRYSISTVAGTKSRRISSSGNTCCPRVVDETKLASGMRTRPYFLKFFGSVLVASIATSKRAWYFAKSSSSSIILPALSSQLNLADLARSRARFERLDINFCLTWAKGIREF